MWKNYASDYIRQNRAGSYSIMAAAFIATLFLSFLCSLFYDFWLDGTENGEQAVPAALAAFYLILIILVCISLILVIHNSFAVTMLNRVHQFGIFSSIGATPGQIRTCLLQEAFMLSLFPVLAGTALGILISCGTVRAMGSFAENLAGGRSMAFSLHPAILFGIPGISLLTVLVSAWIPARKLSRLTPLEAIKGTGELQPVKKKRFCLWAALFGIEGELAGCALAAQRKALRTTTVSLVFAFLGFMLMQCFFTISGISTKHTYFEAYQDAWDVYVTVKDTKIEDFEQMEAIQKIQGTESAVIYQKAKTRGEIPTERISPELTVAGGLEALTGISGLSESDAYMVDALLVVLDDKSFAEYCGRIGLETGEKGAVVYNRIWNSLDSNFRYPEYLPYIKADTEQITLYTADGEKDGEYAVRIPVLACTEVLPILREEYPDYALVQFIPLSLWRKLAAQGIAAEADLQICLLAKDRDSLEKLKTLEERALQIIGESRETESENRIQEKQDNDRMIWGYKMILGGLCVLFALIGIAGMFSNTLGFLNGRKREFARYMSVGVTPAGVRKILCLEAIVLIGRPLVLTGLFTMAASAYMVKISYLDPMEFLEAAPVEPIFAFVAVILGFTAFAYYLGGRKISQIDPVQALRDDTFL